MSDYVEDQIVVVGSVDQRVELRQYPNASRYGDDVVVVGNDGSNVTPADIVAMVQPVKTIVIQSPEHKLLLKMPPRVTMYGPDINLV
jgi:hypothetical protein